MAKSKAGARARTRARSTKRAAGGGGRWNGWRLQVKVPRELPKYQVEALAKQFEEKVLASTAITKQMPVPMNDWVRAVPPPKGRLPKPPKPANR